MVILDYNDIITVIITIVIDIKVEIYGKIIVFIDNRYLRAEFKFENIL